MLAKIRFVDEGKVLRVVESKTFKSIRSLELPSFNNKGVHCGSLEIDYGYYTSFEKNENRLWIGESAHFWPLYFPKYDFENWLKKICPVKVKRTFNKRNGFITITFG